MHDAVGTGEVFDGYKRAKRNHVACAVASLEPDDVLLLQAKARLGLGIHLVGAPEEVEVIDVVAAEERLQSTEDVGDRNTELARPVAVDLVFDLRYVIVELCGDVREFLALIGLCDEVLDGAIEGIQTAAGSIGQDELEAPGLADARDRRRGEYDDIGFLDPNRCRAYWPGPGNSAP